MIGIADWGLGIADFGFGAPAGYFFQRLEGITRRRFKSAIRNPQSAIKFMVKCVNKPYEHYFCD